MGWMAMDRRHIRGFNAAAKEELWDRWQRGESLKAIGRAFGKPSSSIYFQVAPHGAWSTWKLRRQLHVAISKGGLLDIGDRHGGHLFQPCDQTEIMAMARCAAVRDRRAMLGLTASRRGGRRPDGR